MRVLVADMWQADGVAAAAVAPFVRHRQRLARRHGITVRLAPVAGLVALRSRLVVSDADVVVALTPWHADRVQTLALFRALHARPDRPALVYLDSFDQSSSPFFSLPPCVDLYVEKQRYRDLADYGRGDAGGFRFANFVHRRYGVAVPPGWHFGSPLPVDDPAQRRPDIAPARRVPGWWHTIAHFTAWLEEGEGHVARPCPWETREGPAPAGCRM